MVPCPLQIQPLHFLNPAGTGRTLSETLGRLRWNLKGLWRGHTTKAGATWHHDWAFPHVKRALAGPSVVKLACWIVLGKHHWVMQVGEKMSLIGCVFETNSYRNYRGTTCFLHPAWNNDAKWRTEQIFQTGLKPPTMMWLNLATENWCFHEDSFATKLGG